MKENFVTIEGITIDLGKITSYIIDPDRMIHLTFIGGGSLVFFIYSSGEETLSFDEKQLPRCSMSKAKLKGLSEFLDSRFAPKKLQ